MGLGALLDRNRTSTLAVLTLLVVVAFLPVDHDRDATTNYLNSLSQWSPDGADLYDESTNTAANSVEGFDAVAFGARLMLAVVGLVLTLDRPPRNHLATRSPIVVALAGFGGWTLASLLWSIDRQLTLQKLVVLGLLVVAAFGFGRFLGTRDVATLIAACCGSFLAIGLAWELVDGTLRPWDDGYRFTGTTHPTTNSIMAGMLLFWLVPRALGSVGRRQQLAVAGTLATTGLLLIAGSRTTMVALGVAVLAFGIVHATSSARASSRLTPSSAVVGVVIVGCAVGALFLVTGRTEAMTTLNGRVQVWRYLWPWFTDRPVTGNGYLAFWSEAGIREISAYHYWQIPHGHNMYLDVAVDLGVVGLAGFCLLLLTGLVTAARNLTNSHGPDSTAMFAWISLVVVNGLAESLFRLPTFLTFAWVAVVVALAHRPARVLDNPRLDLVAQGLDRDRPVVMLYEPMVHGHPPSYLRNFGRKWIRNPAALDAQLVMVVSSELRVAAPDVVEELAALPPDRLALLEMTPRESDDAAERQATSNDHSWDLFRAYAHALDPDHALVMELDRHQVPIAFGPRSPVPFSAVYFRPTMHYDELDGPIPSLQQRIRDAMKVRLLGRVLARRELEVVLPLDPLATDWLLGRTRTDAITLPDAFATAPPGDDRALRAGLGIEPGRRMLLLLGVLDPRKGPVELLDALAGVDAEVLERHALVLAGPIEPSLADDLERAVARHDDGPLQVVLREGYVRDLDVQTWYAAADVVLTTYQGHMGMSSALVRAALAGTPVISQSYGLMGRLVADHRLGAVVDTSVPHRFTHELGEVLAGEPLVLDASAAVAFSDLHTPERLGEVLIEWCRNVLHRQGIDPRPAAPAPL